MCEVQELNGLQIEENYRNIASFKMFLNSIVECLKKIIQDEIMEVNFLSILGDGSTDAAVIEQEIVFLRYVNPTDSMPVCRQVDIVPLEAANSDGILQALDTGLSQVGLSFEKLKPDNEEIKQSLVMANFDGASVNFGNKNGVTKKLTDINPALISLQCIAHKLELAVLDANKDNLAVMGNFEETLKGLFMFYHYSPKRRRELKDSSDVLEHDLSHISGVKQVRWLSSKERAVKAIKNNYEAVVTHLEHASTDKNSSTDNSSRAKGYHRTITAIKFVRLLHFLLDYLPILANLSKVFQEEKLLIMEIPDRLEETYLALNALKAYPGKNMNEFNDNFNDETLMFGNIKLHKSQGRQPSSAFDATYIDKVVDSTIKYIKKRFEILEEKPISLLMIFNFQKWPIDNQLLAAYGKDELSQLLMDYLHTYFSEGERDRIIHQWPALKVHCRQWRTAKLVNIYSLMLQIKPPHLTDMLKLVEFVMAVSPSTASCERAFSKQNIIKTQLRTSLTQESLRNQLMIMLEGPALKDFNPDSSITQWLESSIRKRHICGHKLKNKVNTDDQIDNILLDSSSKLDS
ncbi:zinc finger protein 862-like [Saccoglossus kowalevskii]|uniref:Zinc finger protein 862-like n=1 Tax=Saccoglossus kowalevskii TaxID=10224 RepID=A0ABM0MT28_SACKO|nr:PREDICTED: zinc finger protein 862-like [Saccoglossus kowalevskii]